MYKELETAKNRLVGTKQVLRALAAGEIATIYIAKDADNAIKEKILIAAGDSVQVVYADSMQELGDCCGIDVRTACAAIKK
ncbi:MAG: ribosomal L7Ae/L30e/S12e/Gadd45 family protein [Eubacteriales bacterium]